MAKRSSDSHELTQFECVTTEKGFYARWSQHKLAYSRGESLAQGSDELKQVSVNAQQQHTVPVDEDAKTPLPPIETLTEHSDLSDFMSSHIADELRLRALRKVFHTAKFNACDGLDDYAENYRVFEPLGDIITADLRHHLERLKQKKATEAEVVSAESEDGVTQMPMAVENSVDISDYDDDAITSEDTPKDLLVHVPKSE